MGRSRGLTKKEMKEHLTFLAAWEAPEFPDIFVYEGKSLDSLYPIAERYREQQQKGQASGRGRKVNPPESATRDFVVEPAREVFCGGRVTLCPGEASD